MVDERLAAAVTADANDFIYQWQASHDYDASAGLSRDRGQVLAINSVDDERNPPETGVIVGCAQTGQEWQALSDPGLDRDARPRHDRQTQSSTSISLKNCCDRPPRARCEAISPEI